MANQTPETKQDRNGGGDVTKAEEVDVNDVIKTKWDLLNNHGPSDFDETRG